MDIIYKSKNAVVVYKPPLMPSQPDPSGDADAMTLTEEALRLSGDAHQLWLVHRLDRVVGGLMVFARNKKSAAKLSELVATDGIGKEYIAVCEGDAPTGELTDLLFKDAKQGKSFVTDRQRAGVKLAKLVSFPIASVNEDSDKRSLVKIKLLTGRFHQIRAQLSSRHAPIVGDGKYGSRDKGCATPALFAYRLKFYLFGERVDVSYLPDIAAYPWSLFDSYIKDLGNSREEK
jgi:23S rRNA pseudouridine1911/1915/1917 synthase